MSREITARLDVLPKGQLLVSQWRGTQLETLLEAIISEIEREYIDPAKALSRQGSIDDAIGVYLDYIGERLVFPRPKTQVSYTKFGFHGGDGVGFNQAPFGTSNPQASDLTQISDSWYRSMLKARGLALLSSGTLADVTACAEALFDTSASVAINQKTITVTAADTRSGYLTYVSSFTHQLLGAPAEMSISIVSA